MMVDLFLESNDNASAVKLINKQVIVKPSATLYTVLGDIYRNEKRPMKAVAYYTTAINMDPTNRRANDGLMSLNQSEYDEDPEDPEDSRMHDFTEVMQLAANPGNSESDAPLSEFETEGR